MTRSGLLTRTVRSPAWTSAAGVLGMRARLAARQTGRMDPRLRDAVEASRRWYDDVFGLHGVAVRVEGDLWSALGTAPPWHSSAKTLAPGIGTARVTAAVASLEHCAVADSFGDLAPQRDGFELLIDAQWLHLDPSPETAGALPPGWSVVVDADDLAEWVAAHDYAGVLPDRVLDHPRFRVLALRRAGGLVGGAITHDAGGVVGLSNAWGEAAFEASDALLAVLAALHPGRAVVDYADGAELEAMVAAGFIPVGPQRVWVR